MAEAKTEARVLPTIVHPFKVHPFGKDLCDATVTEDGRRRTCAQPRALHFDEGQLAAELGRLRKRVEALSAEPSAADAVTAQAAEDYLVAHVGHHQLDTDSPHRPASAQHLGSTWVALLRAVQDRAALRTTANPKES